MTLAFVPYRPKSFRASCWFPSCTSSVHHSLTPVIGLDDAILWRVGTTALSFLVVGGDGDAVTTILRSPGH